MNKKSPVVLCILDGWGLAPPSPYNAITSANPETFNHLLKTYPNAQLFTSGEEVGLPEGQMGNSEVGHMTIGCGRVIEQDLLKINRSIHDGSFFKSSAISKLLENFDKEKNTCHLVGLISDGGVHSHITHTLAIAKFLNDQNIKTQIHVITDGRDTLPKSGHSFVAEIKAFIKSHHKISIATISGRFYTMDRDNRTERTTASFEEISYSKNKTFVDAENAIMESYSSEISDEFIKPQSHQDFEGIKDGDALLFTNFRADRMRQIVKMFAEQSSKNISIFTMIPYSEELEKYTTSLVTRSDIKNTLSEVISNAGLSQFKIAETEKYAHITFFFNAGNDTPYKNEEHVLIDSPKVKTYDLCPEMSAKQVTKTLVAAINSDKYDFLVVNYANADMVGHTGNYQATIEAVKCLDECLKELKDTILEKKGSLFITADHGNAEVMFDKKAQSPYTSHTINPVPFIFVGHNTGEFSISDGTLADIAPTILQTLNIQIPQEMRGKSLTKEMHYGT